MWQLTNWAQRPTRSGLHARRLLKMNVWRLVAWSASGSAHNFPAKSENSCLTTRSCAMSIAGSYSIADQLARTTATARQTLETQNAIYGSTFNLNRFHDNPEPDRIAAFVGGKILAMQRRHPAPFGE